MIVDTSAIMAIVQNEPERALFVAALATAATRSISAGNWIELGAVLTRKRIPELEAELLQLREDFTIAIEPVSAAQAEIGRVAYREYGIGSGHPAHLNFGDCFAYALAKATGEPLLFKGDDFGHTDVVAAG